MWKQAFEIGTFRINNIDRFLLYVDGFEKNGESMYYM